VTSLLPWPGAYLASCRWEGVRRLLERCGALARAGALPGTLMLVGEPGIGREALAVELAAALICRSPRTVLCDCAACDRVRRGIHPDLHVLDVAADATEIKIKQVRDLLETLPQLPYEGRHRVIIIASAHTPPLNTEAASAMLKVLEEPPQHATFILLAGNPARVIPTVVSRAVQVRVPPPDCDELVALLAAAHGVSPAQAESHLRACLDDPGVALRTEVAEGGTLLAAVADLTREACAGGALAALRLGVRAKASPETIPVLARALLAEASRTTAGGAERVLLAAAAVLAADRRRAILHLDAEAVTVGALMPLLSGNPG
jgi:hypothetical protein